MSSKDQVPVTTIAPSTIPRPSVNAPEIHVEEGKKRWRERWKERRRR